MITWDDRIYLSMALGVLSIENVRSTFNLFQ